MDEPIEYGWQRNGSYDPSPDEIATQCEQIRKGWSDRQLEQDQGRPSWQPSVVHVDAKIAGVLNRFS